MNENHFENELRKFNIHKTSTGITIDINMSDLGKRLDLAQKVFDSAISNDMSRYMPVGTTGNLKAQTMAINTTVRGEVYKYPPNSDYGHYQYMGEKYIDPVYGVGGFYGILEGKEGQWWSRTGVTKIPSGEPLIYSQPNATAKWDETAYENHHNEWVEKVRRVLES